MTQHKRIFSTDRELKALKPAADWYDVKDQRTPGLAVRVGPRNSKDEFKRTFVLIARYPGSTAPARRKIGEYGRNGISLEQARETGALWRKLIADGYDPQEARGREAEWADLIRRGLDPREVERERAAKQSARAHTFGSVMEGYLKAKANKRKAKDVEREIRRELIGTDKKPIWKNRPVVEITREDVKKLVKAIAARPAPYQAHNVFGHIRTFFNWAIGEGDYGIETSPCDRLKPKDLIGEKRPRQRTLKDDELRAFWRASGRIRYPFGPMFQLLLLTGCRKAEIAEARWKEFHPEFVRLIRQQGERPINWQSVPNERKLFTVPPERFKSDVSHLVPLSDDACAVIASLPLFKQGDYLFSTTFGKKSISGFSKAKARLDKHMRWVLRAMARKRGDDPKQIELPHFVNHDDRRTVETRLASLKVEGIVRDLVMGHGKKGLQRVYNQHTYIDEMREALEKWAAKLRDLVEPPPANVVKLQPAVA